MALIDDEGDMGVGTIIIFIAIVLASSVTASMMLQSTYVLQEQAERTGSETVSEVSTGIVVVNVIGDRNVYGIDGDYFNSSDPLGPVYDDSNKTKTTQEAIQLLMIQVKLLPGSQNIEMKDVVILVTDGSTRVSLTFDDAESDYKYNASATNYTVEATIDADGAWARGRVFTQNSLLTIYINAGKAGLNFVPETRGDIFFIPKYGAQAYENFMTPNFYLDRIIVLP